MCNNKVIKVLTVLLAALLVLGGCKGKGKAGEKASVALTITSGGTYTIEGTHKGTVVVDTEQALTLTLKGADITAENGPAIYVKNCKALELCLEGDNTLTDGKEYAAEYTELKGALFSEDDLTVSGSGNLTVIGNYRHAIAGDDAITINSGTVTVTSAVKDGVHANDLVEIKGGSLTVKAAEGDAIESEAVVKLSGGTVSLAAKGDGIKASTNGETDCAVNVSGGSLTVNVGEDGVQSDGTLDINGGTLDITTTGAVSNNAATDKWGGGMGGGRSVNIDGMPTAPDMSAPTMGDFSMDPNMSMPDMGGRPNGGTKPTRPNGGNNGTMPGGNFQPNGGTETETTDGVSSKGIKSTGVLTISNGTININSTDDAVHSNSDVTIIGGKLTVKTGDDGIHADGALSVKGGDITVSNSYEALEGKTVDVADGTLSLTASDDGINATSGGSTNNRPGNANGENSININGGSVYINAAGDGVDSNGNLTVNGGILCVEGSGNGNSAIDADGTRLVNGGVVVAAGGGDMLENPQASSKQNCAVIMCNLSAGTTAALTDKDGNVIFCYTLTKSARSLTISMQQLTVGESYTLYSGVTPTGNKAFGGLYYGNSIGFSGGTAVKTFTQTAVITQAR